MGIRFIRKKVVLMLVAGMLLLPAACLKDFPETFPTSYEWNPLLAFPIGWAEFGLNVGQGFDTLLLDIDTSSGFPFWASELVIPFSGNVFFDFEEVLGEREEITMVQLRVNAYNGFPVDIKVQGYLVDRWGHTIDSLFSPHLVMARGKLSAGGETVTSSQTQVDILFDQARLDVLLEAREISFAGEISNVAYFPEFTFEVQMGAIMGIVQEF